MIKLKRPQVLQRAGATTARELYQAHLGKSPSAPALGTARSRHSKLGRGHFLADSSASKTYVARAHSVVCAHGCRYTVRRWAISRFAVCADHQRVLRPLPGSSKFPTLGSTLDPEAQRRLAARQRRRRKREQQKRMMAQVRPRVHGWAPRHHLGVSHDSRRAHSMARVCRTGVRRWMGPQRV